MLRRLTIENVGLIERAEVEFSPGATLFTGETGSGKTMLLGALALALGERASAEMVRSRAGKAVVTLWFDADDALRERLSADGFALDAGEEAAIVREVGADGRSSARLCGKPATAVYVREIAARLADTIGQFEAQRLLAPAFHAELLDRFAGARAIAVRQAVAQAHARLHDLRAKMAALHDDAQRSQRERDDAREALDEIDAARLEPGEDRRLEERRRVLDNLERITVALRAAHEALAGDEGSAVEDFGSALRALDAVAPYGEVYARMADRLRALQSDANDLALDLSRELDAGEFDNGELEAINARLDALAKLKRRYGPSLDDVHAHQARAREVVDAFERHDEREAELRAAMDVADSAMCAAAGELTNLRRDAARALTDAIAVEFADLALAAGRFDVRLEPYEQIGPNGAERVEFLFSANPGEALRSLAKCASGGELSRLLLALVVTLATSRERTALVFDEIDAGIGGATARAVGARIARLARGGQVMCVTHLAQIAAYADAHYVLTKHERDGTTTIGVRLLAAVADREAEIARMLSGETHDAALTHARALLGEGALRDLVDF